MSPEPYWRRLGKAMLLLSVAVALHLWVVRAPEPQEPVYSLLASRVISSILIAPPLPLAPPLRLTPKRRSGERVTLHTAIMNVPALPGPPLPGRSSAINPAVIPIGTMGVMARTVAMDGPGPSTASGDASVETLPHPAPTTDSIPAPTAAPPAILASSAPAAPRSEPPLTPPERTAPAPERLVAATSGHIDTTPVNTFDEERRRQEVVLAVVHEYARALERLDVRATKAVYPTVDGRELRRAFEGLKGQQYHIASCGVRFSASGEDARARCTGNATFRPKVGSRVLRLTDYEWVINLARGGGGWQILEAQILDARIQ